MTDREIADAVFAACVAAIGVSAPLRLTDVPSIKLARLWTAVILKRRFNFSYRLIGRFLGVSQTMIWKYVEQGEGRALHPSFAPKFARALADAPQADQP